MTVQLPPIQLRIIGPHAEEFCGQISGLFSPRSLLGLHATPQEADLTLVASPLDEAESVVRGEAKLARHTPILLVLPQCDTAARLRAQRWGAVDAVGRDCPEILSSTLRREAICARYARELARANRLELESEARMHALSASIPGVIFRLSRNSASPLQLEYASEASKMLFGYTPPALIAGRPRLLDLIVEADRAGFLATLQDSDSHGHAFNWEGRVQCAEGDIKWINLRATPSRPRKGCTLWEGVMWNITHSKRTEQDLRKSRARLTELSAHLEQAKEEERERIARDIHDVLGGHLVAIKIELSLLLGKHSKAHPELQSQAASIRTLVDEAIETVGRVTRELRPGLVRDFGLAAAIESQAEDFSRRTGIGWRFDCPDHDLDLPEEVAIAMFRIVQEALTNVYKHAQARQVSVALRQDAECTVLEIADDGCGIRAEETDKPLSFGLRGIRERITRFGGKIEVTPGANGGTILRLRVPASFSALPAAIEDLPR